jgi:hypothetical protein
MTARRTTLLGAILLLPLVASVAHAASLSISTNRFGVFTYPVAIEVPGAVGAPVTHGPRASLPAESLPTATMTPSESQAPAEDPSARQSVPPETFAPEPSGRASTPAPATTEPSASATAEPTSAPDPTEALVAGATPAPPAAEPSSVPTEGPVASGAVP